MTGVPYKKRLRHRHSWREGLRRLREKPAVYKPKREALNETKPADVLIPDF